jgi:hypothetical protein
MKQIANLWTARIFACAALLAVSAVLAAAENEVLESNVADYPVGTKIEDEARIVMPEDSNMRVLIVTTGSTKTLQGPYEGTIPNYKDERSWWERITGRGKDSDAPIGATRGLLPPKTDQPQ